MKEKTATGPDTGLRKAFAAAAEKAGKPDDKGGKVALAAMLGISKQATSRWRRIPPTRVLDVEDATGIPREELRPDIYGRGRRRRNGSPGFVGSR